MQTFATPAPISAVLDIPAGRVQFIAADRSDTTVEVRPADPSKPRDVKVAEQTRVDFADGVLRIEAKAKNQILGSSGYIEVTVQLPADSSVIVKAASADFRAVGRLGEVSFDGAEGAIKLDEAATATLKAQAGNIELGRLTGPAEITTAKGDIRITEATAGALVLTTQSGNVEVGAARGVSASLDAGTILGRIHNALKNAEGTPSLTIHATTSHGDIKAHSL